MLLQRRTAEKQVLDYISVPELKKKQTINII